MDKIVFRSMRCPSCSGEIDLPEGTKTFNCKYCGEMLVLKGPTGIFKYCIHNKFSAETAVDLTFEWLRKGNDKAEFLAQNSNIDDVFLVYVPYWRIRTGILGLVLGIYNSGKSAERTENILTDTYDINYPACDTEGFGIKQVFIKGRELEPFYKTTLQEEGMVFSPVSSQKDITSRALDELTKRSLASCKLAKITFSKVSQVMTDISIVYYPFWIVRYKFKDRIYQVVVDGYEGVFRYANAPGSNLKRARRGILYTAISMYMFTFFGIFGLIQIEHRYIGVSLFAYLICILIGVIYFRKAWKAIRYGGEIEQF